jgi:hypothetical protein
MRAERGNCDYSALQMSCCSGHSRSCQEVLSRDASPPAVEDSAAQKLHTVRPQIIPIR